MASRALGAKVWDRQGELIPAGAERGRVGCQPKLFASMADHFAGDRAAIEAGEVLFHCGCEQ
jgi:hypothetical protein